MQITVGKHQPWASINVLPHGQQEDAKVSSSGYGWDVTSYEWELTFRATARQDGRSDCLLALTEVDGVVRVLKALVPTGEVANFIALSAVELTSHWTNPLLVTIL